MDVNKTLSSTMCPKLKITSCKNKINLHLRMESESFNKLPQVELHFFH